jgi:hypothetical protein
MLKSGLVESEPVAHTVTHAVQLPRGMIQNHHLRELASMT